MLTSISLKVDNTVASMYRGNVAASLLFTYCFLFWIILKQYPQPHKTHRMLLLPNMHWRRKKVETTGATQDRSNLVCFAVVTNH